MTVASMTDLQHLAEVVDDDEAAISVYLDLSPADTPTRSDLASRVSWALDHLGTQRPESKAGRLVFDAGRDRVAEFLRAEDPRGGRHVHGAAVFAHGGDTFAAFPLWRETSDFAAAGKRFALRSLAAQHSRTSEVLVLEIGRELGRVLALEDGRIAEVVDADRHIENRHRRGAWSASHLQRWVDRDAELHISEVTSILERVHTALGRPPVVLAGTDEHVARVRAELSTEVGEVVIGTLGNARDLGEAQLHRELRRLADEHDADRERRLLERRDEQLGRGDVAPGLTGALAAVSDMRAETLLVSRAAEPDVFVCPACGRLADHAEVCPYDGTFMQHEGLDAVVAMTLGQAATVWELIDADRRDLDGSGGLGVVTRF